MCKIQIALFLFLLSAAPSASAQNEFVYMVRADLPGMQHAALATGFRLAGTKGIITCLHAVAGGKNISALNDSQDVLVNLHVAAVDIRQDLALLQSDELLKRPDAGLVSAATLPRPGQPLLVLGHPDGIKLYPKPVAVGRDGTRSLHSTAPPSAIDLMDKRKSPELAITIIPIDGNMIPGDSGAPALNDKQEVEGIIDGGLKGGAAAITWAIPVLGIDWELAGSAHQRLQSVIDNPVDSLFAMQTDAAVQLDKIILAQAGNGDYRLLKQALDHVAPGGTIVVRPGSYDSEGLRIGNSVTISGEGSRDLILFVGAPRLSGTTLEHLTLQSGKKTTFISGRVTISDCDFSSSTDTFTTGVFGDESLVVKNSLIASSGGDFHAAIEMQGGTLEVSDSTLRGFGNEYGIRAITGIMRVSKTVFSNLSHGIDTNSAEVQVSTSDFVTVYSKFPIGGVGTHIIREHRNTCGNDQYCNDQP